MHAPSERLDVGILGATGTVGQEFIAQLQDHPWFNLTWLAASQRSEGRRYADATPWRLATPRPYAIADMKVRGCVPDGAPRVVFSGLDASVAGEIEEAFAAAGHVVISNARNYRMEPDVPLLVPEINAHHLALMPRQQTARGWSGGVVTNPNCSTVTLTMALAPLGPFGLRTVNVSTLQAVSGAGYPGVASLDIVGNVVPFIGGEEEKMESETQKIFGSLSDDGGGIEPHPVVVSAHCTRVPVINGHTLMVSVGLDRTPPLDELREAFRAFTARPQEERLPSAPANPVVYLDEPNRPQPRLDADRNGGMTVSVGRLRPCPGPRREVRGARSQHDPRRRRRGAPERRAHDGRRVAHLEGACGNPAAVTRGDPRPHVVPSRAAPCASGSLTPSGEGAHGAPRRTGAGRRGPASDGGGPGRSPV